MIDFVFWNLIFGIAWVLWNIIRWLLPKSMVVSVVSRGRSAIHGEHAVLLVNDKTHKVFRNGPLWRYQTTGHVLPSEWAEILDSNPDDIG